MHHRARDITGQTSGYLTAVSYAGSNGKKSLWLIRCECGREFTLPATEFLKGKQKSCGCKTSELIGNHQRTHGMSGHPAYAVWRSMIDRCRLPTHQAWESYGGRGIWVCEAWANNFEAFWADMGATYKPGLSLDRIDVNGPYSPENCRWVSVKSQNRNRRSNRVIDTPWGQLTVAEASEKSGVGVTTLLYRLDQGVPPALLFSPPDVRNRFTTSSTPGQETDLLCSDGRGR